MPPSPTLSQHTWKSEGQVFYSNWISSVLRRRAAAAAATKP